MKSGSSIFILGLGILLTTLAACEAEETPPARSRKLDKEKFGKLPGQEEAEEEDDSFMALLDEGGQPLSGTANRDTTLDAGAASCAIPKGTRLFLVAQRRLSGKQYYIAQLAEPCRAGQGLRLKGSETDETGGAGTRTGVDGNNNGNGAKPGTDAMLGEGNVPASDVDVGKPGSPGSSTDGGGTVTDTGETPTGTITSNGGCVSVEQTMTGMEKQADQNSNRFARRWQNFCSSTPTVPVPLAAATPVANDPATAVTPNPWGIPARPEKDGKDGKDRKKDQPDILAKIKDMGRLCMIPGEMFRNPSGKGDVKAALKIKTSPAKLKFNIASAQFTTWGRGGKAGKNGKGTGDTLPEKTVDVTQYKTANADEYLVPFDAFVPPNDWVGRSISMKIAAVDSEGKSVGKECTHDFRLASPIVLDFSGAETVKTVPAALSNARFDLDADGRTERVGWIAPGSALLARDLNGNGRIDDGRELFGEATALVDGRRAADGYEALAALAPAGHPRLTAADRAFGELYAWFDDGDGVSQPAELKRLSEVGVTALDVRGERVSDEVAMGPGGFGTANYVPLRARFHGPAACGSGGCYSHDVWFGSLADRVAGLDR